MSATVLPFPVFSSYGPKETDTRRRLALMFAGRSIADMRVMWDGVDYDSFYHAPDGRMYDCADIHLYMNMLGDGEYCAV